MSIEMVGIPNSYVVAGIGRGCAVQLMAIVLAQLQGFRPKLGVTRR
jgi:hypothetical protein